MSQLRAEAPTVLQSSIRTTAAKGKNLFFCFLNRRHCSGGRLRGVAGSAGEQAKRRQESGEITGMHLVQEGAAEGGSN